MKYIDADKLIAEIKGIVADVQVKERPDVFGSLEQCLAASEIEALNLVIETINELQQEQPEVNLEKEATKFVQSKEFIESKESPVLLTARYFYELGLNARKEAPNDSVCEGYACEEYEAFTTGNVTGIRIKQKPSEDLEKAAEEYCLTLSGFMPFSQKVATFKAGAQWQKVQMTKEEFKAAAEILKEKFRADNLDIVEFAFELERRLGISIPDEWLFCEEKH